MPHTKRTETCRLTFKYRHATIRFVGRCGGMADAGDLKSSGVTRVGSSPTTGTKKQLNAAFLLPKKLIFLTLFLQNNA